METRRLSWNAYDLFTSRTQNLPPTVSRLVQIPKGHGREIRRFDTVEGPAELRAYYRNGIIGLTIDGPGTRVVLGLLDY